jgi:hypothetical protein
METVSAMEDDRINLGAERSKILSRALVCHSAVLALPGWQIPLDAQRFDHIRS